MILKITVVNFWPLNEYHIFMHVRFHCIWKYPFSKQHFKFKITLLLVMKVLSIVYVQESASYKYFNMFLVNIYLIFNIHLMLLNVTIVLKTLQNINQNLSLSRDLYEHEK